MDLSVLISVYAKESAEYFRLSLESIVEQTLQPFETVVVADGQLTPELYCVIDDFTSRLRIKLIQLPENVGLGMALGAGLAHCQCDLIARVDSDDISFPERFQRQCEFLLRHPEISAVSAYLAEFVVEPGDLNRQKKVPVGQQAIHAYARKRNPLNHPAVMLRKANVLAVGSYMHMPFFEDYYLWLRMLKQGYRLDNIPQPLVHFRVGNDMIGRRHGLSYVRHELRFLKKSNKEGLITTASFLSLVSVRIPVRLIPKTWLNLLYRKALR